MSCSYRDDWLDSESGGTGGNECSIVERHDSHRESRRTSGFTYSIGRGMGRTALLKFPLPATPAGVSRYMCREAHGMLRHPLRRRY